VGGPKKKGGKVNSITFYYEQMGQDGRKGQTRSGGVALGVKIGFNMEETSYPRQRRSKQSMGLSRKRNTPKGW